jgi:hypothetical protein
MDGHGKVIGKTHVPVTRVRDLESNLEATMGKSEDNRDLEITDWDVSLPRSIK